MKNYFFVILSFLAIYSSAQVTYGLKTGVNVSKIDEIHSGSEKRIGMYIGGFASIPLQDYNQQYFIQPEIMYSMMGEKEEGDEDVNIDYIIVPVLFKTYFSEKETEFFGELGPQIGFLVNSKLPDSDKNFEYKTLDYGLTIGLGFSYLKQWEVGARFYYGLADIIEGEVLNDDPKNINSNINVGIAYIF